MGLARKLKRNQEKIPTVVKLAMKDKINKDLKVMAGAYRFIGLLIRLTGQDSNTSNQIKFEELLPKKQEG